MNLTERQQRMNTLAGDYRGAFIAANPGAEAPKITYDNGWFIIGKHRYRKVSVERMMQTLQDRVKIKTK